MLTELEIQRRLPVWQALADLFLDTEPQDYTYAAIESERLKAGYTREEVHGMLADQVCPAFIANLRMVAGEWELWTLDEVRERVLPVVDRPRWRHWLAARNRAVVATFWSAYLRQVAGPDDATPRKNP